MKIGMVIAVVLLLGCFETNADYAGVDAVVSLRLSYFNSSAVAQPIPEGWESGFDPQGGSMSLDKGEYGLETSLALGLEPVWRAESVGWTIGIPVIYTLPLADFRKEAYDFKTTVGYTEVDWWNKVSLLEIQMERKLPAVGISLRKRDSNWGFQYLAQPYSMSLVVFEGVDRVGDANISKPLRSHSIEDGLGHLFEISFGPKDDSVPVELTLRFERYGADVWAMGIGLSFCAKLLNSHTKKP